MTVFPSESSLFPLLQDLTSSVSVFSFELGYHLKISSYFLPETDLHNRLCSLIFPNVPLSFHCSSFPRYTFTRPPGGAAFRSIPFLFLDAYQHTYPHSSRSEDSTPSFIFETYGFSNFLSLKAVIFGFLPPICYVRKPFTFDSLARHHFGVPPSSWPAAIHESFCSTQVLPYMSTASPLIQLYVDDPSYGHLPGAFGHWKPCASCIFALTASKFRSAVPGPSSQSV
ncbi:hypothetical protein NMY22_g4193 [Coprinellus aureogranulatus]|nr:hypothetical protein NMY22_g4193 [Coprinellus aureogranulatus]